MTDKKQAEVRRTRIIRSEDMIVTFDQHDNEIASVVRGRSPFDDFCLDLVAALRNKETTS